MFTLLCNFNIDNNRRINIFEQEVCFNINKTQICKLYSREEENEQQKTILESKALSIKCENINNEDIALEYAKIIFTKLHYFGLKYDVKIDKEFINGEFGNHIKLNGKTALGIDSILIYDDKETPFIFTAAIDYYKTYNDDKDFFISSMESENINSLTNQKSLNSIDYFNDSLHENNPKLKLLKMMMSLESLISLLTENKRNKTLRERQLLDNTIEELKTKNYQEKDIETLITSLGYLKEKSVKHQIVELFNVANIKTPILNLSVKQFIIKCYSIRSDISHGNDLNKNKFLRKYNIKMINAELYKITKLLLIYFHENNLLNKQGVL